MPNTVFITGATGNIGGMLLCHLLEDASVARIIALVRAESVAEAKRRITGIVKTLQPELNPDRFQSRLTVVTGDITAPKMGMAATAYEQVATSVTHLVHCAASTRFNVPLKEARYVNCRGVVNVMDLAADAFRRGRLERIGYVSTAYVNGHHRGTIREDDLISHPRFCNNYEQSKWEAESYVKGLMDRLPICVFRPAIVVGDSRTGRTIAFNVLYSPLKHVCSGAVNVLPGSRDTILDVVPVDYVAEAIKHILLNAVDPIGKTFNLTAGPENSLSTGQIVSRALTHTAAIESKDPAVRVRFVPMLLFRAVAPFLRGRARRLMNALNTYAPYICQTSTFDDTNTRQALSESGISVPRFADYIDTILSLWQTARYSKKLKPAA